MFSRLRSPARDSSETESSVQGKLERARCGDAEALSALYHQFLPGVFGYIVARVPDRGTAEDLTSEVFLRVVEGIGQLRTHDEPQFAAWLFQIARAVVAGYYRKVEKQPKLVALEPLVEDEIISGSEGADPALQIEVREEWGNVVRAMNSLTEEQRLVLVGRLIMGYDVATVAKMIGKNANAVKALQFRALNSLQRILGKQDVPQDAAYSHGKQGRRRR